MKKFQDLKDQRLRAIAELENFRKRAEKDQSDALKYGVTNFAKEIINIKDNIERAQSSVFQKKFEATMLLNQLLKV
jgi:molecular chaperone GrpE